MRKLTRMQWSGAARSFRAVALGLCLLGVSAAAVAQITTTSASGAAAPKAEKIRTRADSLNYDREKGIIEGIGHVIVRKGDIILRADYVSVNSVTEIADAQGNVRITRGEEEWTGDSVKYNFRTGEGATLGLAGSAEPFYLASETVNRTAEGMLLLQSATITTCENEPGHRHFHIKAREVEVKPDEYLKARGGIWRFGKVPVLYLPYWFKDLDDEFGWRFVPGHNSRMGTFLLTSYRYRINPSLKAETHFDVRTERGVALGQDLWWNVDDVNEGSLKIYFADDQEPIDDDEDTATADIDDSRYRIRFQDRHAFTEKDSLLIYGHKLSDTDITEDFFEDEYRDERQPDNYISYTHYEEAYTVNAVMRSRLDAFYESVNRLPEVSLDIFRNQIGDSRFYYQSETAAANLERVFPDGSTSEDYDTFRFDTEHTFLRPDRHFGYLNLTPRIGFRGTHYSETRRVETVTETAAVTEETVVGGVTSTVITASSTTNTFTRNVAGGADFRNSVEIGFEASFKAFKTWQNINGEPRRHIVEPYANYTYIPEPSLTPDEVYQFDSVDALDESHFVVLGVRNKLQTKRDEVPFDLVDLNVFAPYNFNTADGQDALENVFWDGEMRPNQNFAVDFDGNFNLDTSEVGNFNTELTWMGFRSFEAAAEYRYRNDSSSQLFGDVTLCPEHTWSYNLYGRYEFEESRFQEQGGYVQRTYDCLSFRVGGNILPGFTRSDGSERDDEWRLLLEFWLTDFPEFSLSGKHKS